MFLLDFQKVLKKKQNFNIKIKPQLLTIKFCKIEHYNIILIINFSRQERLILTLIG